MALKNRQGNIIIPIIIGLLIPVLLIVGILVYGKIRHGDEIEETEKVLEKIDD